MTGSARWRWRLASLLLALGGAFGAAADASFESAASHYRNGAYAAARAELERSIALAPQDAALQYALGLSAAQQGDCPGAMIALRRAQRLEPGWRDVALALDAVRARCGIDPPPDEPRRALLRWIGRLPRSGLLGLAVACAVAASAWFLRRGSARGPAVGLAAIALCCALPEAIGGLLERSVRDAVVGSSGGSAHTGPSVRNPVAFALPAGLEVAADDPIDGWVRVETALGSGWLRCDAVVAIDPARPACALDSSLRSDGSTANR